MGIIKNLFGRRVNPKQDAVEKMAGFMTAELGRVPGRYMESDKLTDYADFIDAFKSLPWLYAGAMSVAVAATKARLRVYEETAAQGKTERKEVTGTELNRLLTHPNPFLGEKELLQVTIINLFVTGEGYWNLVGTKEKAPVSRTNLPVEIWWVKPEQMEIAPDAKDFIRNYTYKASGGTETTLDPSEVIHFKRVNPDSYFRGLGAAEPAKNSLILDANAIAYNRAFIENDASPWGVFITPEKMSRDQRKQWRDDWAAQHSGARNAGNFGFLYGGVDYKEIGKAPKDAQLQNLRKMNREEILAVLGVPPSIVGLLEYANYSNMEIQEKKFWDDTVIPILNIISDKLNLQLAPLFNDRYIFEFDMSAVKALQEDEERKARVATMLIANGVKTPNQVRREMYNAEPYAGGGQYYMGMGLSAVGSDETDATNNAAEGEDEAAASTEPKRLHGKGNEKKPSFWRQGERAQVLWTNFDKRLRKKEKTLREALAVYFRAQGREVRERFERHNSPSEITAADLPDPEKEGKEFREKFRKLYLSAFKSAGQAGLDATKGMLYDPDLTDSQRAALARATHKQGDEPEFEVSEALQAKVDAIVLRAGVEINEATRKELWQLVRHATEENLSMTELAQEIWATFDERFSGVRSRLIAETEMHKVENFGQLEGYKENEFIERKGWLCMFLPKSREGHMEADRKYSNETIPLNEPFHVRNDQTGEMEELQYPGDSSADAANVCNCRCSTFPEVPEL